MLSFWLVETLVGADIWQAEPWFEPAELFRRPERARARVRHWLEEHAEFSRRHRRSTFREVRRQLGGFLPDLPDPPTVCRIVKAEGRRVDLGTVTTGGRLFRKPSVLGPPRRRRNRRGFYLLVEHRAGGNFLVHHPNGPRGSGALVGFNTLAAALAHRWKRNAVWVSLLRVDARLSEVERHERA